jgi:NADPH:quinone reductase-like Zn-dependent oxidoreductase
LWRDLTAAAALDAIDPQPGDTVLVGGAPGGVGVLLAQLPKIAGATICGTCSEGTFESLRSWASSPPPTALGSPTGYRRPA